MRRKFQYILMGAGLTFLVIVGALSLILSDTQADELVSQEDVKQINDTHPSTISSAQIIMEEDPIPNVLNNQSDQETLERTANESTSPVISEDKRVDSGEAVLVQVANLNEQRMKSLPADGGGWLFVQAERYAPNSSNGPLPNGSDLPVSQRIENWYHVDADGLATQSYDRMLDANGVTVQEGYFKEGTFYKEIYEQTFEAETETFVVLPDKDSYGFLSRDFESGGELTGWIEKQEDQTVYIATSTTSFENPVQFGVSPYKVVSTRYHFVYDMADGAFLYGETVLVLESGEEIVWESITQTKFEMVSEAELPEKLTQFLAED